MVLAAVFYPVVDTTIQRSTSCDVEGTQEQCKVYAAAGRVLVSSKKSRKTRFFSPQSIVHTPGVLWRTIISAAEPHRWYFKRNLIGNSSICVLVLA